MVLTLRQIILSSIPTMVAIVGFLWFRRKKKDPPITWVEDMEEVPTEVKAVQTVKNTGPISTDTVVLVKPSIVKSEMVLQSMAKPIPADEAISPPSVNTCSKTGHLPHQGAMSGDKFYSNLEELLVNHIDTLPLEDLSMYNNVSMDVNCSQLSSSPLPVDDFTSAEPVMEDVVVAVSNTAVTNSVPLPSCDEQLSDDTSDSCLDTTLVVVNPSDTIISNICPATEGVVADVEAVVNGDDLLLPVNESCGLTNGVDINGRGEDVNLIPKGGASGDNVVNGVAEKTPGPAVHATSASGDCDHTNHHDVTDAHSEVSSDSGRGASGIETPTATSPSELSDFVVYEFDFPSEFCGKLIGKAGKNINNVKARTGAEIILKRKPFVRDYQNCCIEGTQVQVKAALEEIGRRFPTKQFNITYKQTNVLDESPVLVPEIMQVCLQELSLPEGVSVDCVVSSVVQANHIFVQQPTHPTFSSLESLNVYMNACYTQDNVVPQLPRPIDAGVICAAPVFQGWYRAQLMAFYEETDDCDVKYVDYGGYMRVPAASLRQIRSDFATLPFQAVECYLANVMPLEGEEEMSVEASVTLESMVQGQLLQAQITDHEADGVPYVQLYNLSGAQAVFVNRELVDRGVAQWVETQG